MTLTRRLAQRQETRAMAGWPSGQTMIDPTAIPPPGYGNQSAAGVVVNTHSALSLEVVQTAIRVISAGVIKRGNLRAYQTKVSASGIPYREWTADQPPLLTNTFAFPGPITNTQSRGRSQTVMSMALFGEAWWIIHATDRLGNATAVEVLYPPLLTNKRDHLGTTVYEYGTGMDRTVIDPDKLVHIPLASLPTHQRGLSTIEYASVVYGLALAAYRFSELWFGQGAAPSYFLSSDQDLSEEIAQRIAQRFRVEHSGLTQAHLPLVAGSGLNVQKLGTTAEGAQMLGTLAYVRTCIGSMFGIPSHLLGGEADKGNVWGASYEEVAQQMEDFTFTSFVIPLEEAHSKLLAPGTDAAFLDSLIRPNSYNLGQEIMALRNTDVATQNEVRALKLGLPPVDGGDVLGAPLASNVSGSAQTDTSPAAPAVPPDDLP